MLPEVQGPILTKSGRKEAEEIQSKTRQVDRAPQLLVSSSLCKILQTVGIAFEELFTNEKALPFLSHSALGFAHELTVTTVCHNHYC